MPSLRSLLAKGLNAFPAGHIWLERRRWRFTVLESPRVVTRRELGKLYLRGSGIEIGALHVPMPVSRDLNIQYVDRFSKEAAIENYPELAPFLLNRVDVIDDAEALQHFSAGSLDFIIANHVLEHTQNPISTLELWLGKLRPQGVLFFALPDKDQCFDRLRPATTLKEVVLDYENGPSGSLRGHYEDWATHVDIVPEETRARQIEEWIATDYNIHFHTWTLWTFFEVLSYCKHSLQFPFELVHYGLNFDEFVTVLRKH